MAAPAQTEPPKGRGKKPIPYDPDLAMEICERVAVSEDSLDTILEALRNQRAWASHRFGIVGQTAETIERACVDCGARDIGEPDKAGPYTGCPARPQEAWVPKRRLVFVWLVEYEDFAKKMRMARWVQSWMLFERAQDYARHPLVGEIRTEERDIDGKLLKVTTKTIDNVERSKLLVQTTLRRAANLNPREFGDKVEIKDGGGSNTNLSPNYIAAVCVALGGTGVLKRLETASPALTIDGGALAVLPD